MRLSSNFDYLSEHQTFTGINIPDKVKLLGELGLFFKYFSSSKIVYSCIVIVSKNEEKIDTIKLTEIHNWMHLVNDKRLFTLYPPDGHFSKQPIQNDVNVKSPTITVLLSTYEDYSAGALDPHLHMFTERSAPGSLSLLFAHPWSLVPDRHIITGRRCNKSQFWEGLSCCRQRFQLQEK